ncbi:hypothetical protein U1Q18_033791 [Sarracenia purpurea var. burkii]
MDKKASRRDSGPANKPRKKTKTIAELLSGSGPSGDISVGRDGKGGIGTKNPRVYTKREEKAQDVSKVLLANDVNIPQSNPGSGTSGRNYPSSNLPLVKVGDFYWGNFLFQMHLTPRDVRDWRLSIPFEIAKNHFPLVTETTHGIFREDILISDAQNYQWPMRFIFYPRRKTCTITRDWQRFVDFHRLEAKDLIRFYRPHPRAHDMHYLIEIIENEKLVHTDSSSTVPDKVPEFKPDNFLVELQLTYIDVSFDRLIILEEDVWNLFPAARIPPRSHFKERLKLTDANNKNWCMKMAFHSRIETYIVVEGWGDFVNEHKLNTLDTIKFYRPVNPLHPRHFLIECVKRLPEIPPIVSYQAGTTEQSDDIWMWPLGPG